MRLDLLAVVVVALVALAVPTAAMATGGGDQVGGAVELAPHPGPNGQYASIQNGELRVDFERLNDEAITTADDVFTVTASGDDRVFVTVRTNDPAIEAYRGSGRDVGPGNPVLLDPGEGVDVGFRIDTVGADPDDATVTVTARTVSGAIGPRPAVREPDGEEVPPEDDRAVEVLFPEETVSDREVDVQWLDGLPADDPPFEPEAVIQPDVFSPAGTGLQVDRGRLVAGVGEPVALTGRASVIGEAEAIARNLQVAAVVDVSPPSSLRDRRATVRLRIPRERIDDPAEATVVRRTPRGWQLLETRVVDVGERTVTLEAETFGFSVFAVVGGNDVAYEWEKPDGSVVRSPDLRTSFDEPGRYDVSLTVTDAAGRSDRTVRQVLANDRPTIEIRGADERGPDGETRLRANVTNVVGNTTVTWTLPDGSTAEGRNLTGTFESGDVVRATVEDEFGERATARAVIGAAAPARGEPAPGSDFVPATLPLWLQALLAVSAVGLSVIAARSGASVAIAGVGRDGLDALESILDRLTGDSPRIVAFENPSWNPAADAVEIERLAIEAPSGHLGTIEITVADQDGREVVRKTIDAGGEASFAEGPVRIPVYGGVELSDTDRYTVEVRAVDEFDRVGSRGYSRDLGAGGAATG